MMPYRVGFDNPCPSSAVERLLYSPSNTHSGRTLKNYGYTYFFNKPQKAISKSISESVVKNYRTGGKYCGEGGGVNWQFLNRPLTRDT